MLAICSICKIRSLYAERFNIQTYKWYLKAIKVQRSKCFDSQHCLVFYPDFVIGHIFFKLERWKQLAIYF